MSVFKTGPTGLLIVGLLVNSAVSLAAVEPKLSFPEVWRAVLTQSYVVKSQLEALRSKEIARNRAARHWFPQIHFGARSFYTDDPGSTLFSKLGERNISGSDFAPTVMNFPEFSRHETMSIQARLMLFEGGMKTSISESMDLAYESKEQESKAVEVGEYSRALGYYGGLVVLERKRTAILPIKQLIERTLGRYQLGSRANPLGYSGLLGLKTLQQRLAGELLMVDAQRSAILENLHLIGGLPEHWAPESESLTGLFEKHIDQGFKGNAAEAYSVRALRLGSDSVMAAARAERARYLPHIGVFAQHDSFNNSDTNLAHSKTLGVFLHWELFSAENYGAVSQAQAQARSIELMADHGQREQATSYKRNLISMQALLEQVKMADSSLALLEEQAQIAQKLFLNGMINVLQLSEVYARRVDIISARTQMEEALLKSKIELLNMTPYQLPL